MWRTESPKIIAVLTRMTGEIGTAEDLSQDALLAALDQWPVSGIPDNPAAWLMSIAKRKAIDFLRRGRMADQKHELVAHELAAKQSAAPAYDDVIDDHVGDDLLRLIFIACHPILPREARAALTLRLLGGLTTDEIGRAFLTAEPTIAQRIVRAKKTIADEKLPFEVPPLAEMHERLGSVLEVVYLVFNEGYTATAGADWTRRDLCDEALRLGRLLADLMPGEAEVHGLLALMEIQASRLGARTDTEGTPILLLDQDRTRWNGEMIDRGLSALELAESLGGVSGPYQLQAAIAACHARARNANDTDWRRIAALYDELMSVAPSPVVELNRAVAVAMAFGPADGLAIVDMLMSEPKLRSYHLLPSVRGDLLVKLGRMEEARAEFERAAALTRNERERALLLDRAK